MLLYKVGLHSKCAPNIHVLRLREIPIDKTV